MWYKIYKYCFITKQNAIIIGVTILILRTIVAAAAAVVVVAAIAVIADGAFLSNVEETIACGKISELVFQNR